MSITAGDGQPRTNAQPVPNADTAPDSIFVADDQSFVPTSLAEGPWGPFINGQFVGGLLGRAIEQDACGEDMQFARLTIDLSRRVKLEPVSITTTWHRQGARVLLIDAVMVQDEHQVARARAVLLRPSEQPENEVWSSPVFVPPIPDNNGAAPEEYPVRAWVFNSETPNPDGDDYMAFLGPGQKFMWMRFVNPLIHGEPLTPFTRAAMAADATNAVAHFGKSGLHFINADYTVTLSRLPEGPFIGLGGLSHYSGLGVATGTAAMFDQQGPIGNCMSVGILNSGFPQVDKAQAAK